MAQHDLALIRFLTRRQSELRGLHTAIFGAWMAALLAVSAALPLRGGGLPKLIWFICVMTLPHVAQELASRWYASRVGRVGSPTTFLQPRVPWLLLLGGIALDISGLTPIAGRSAFLFLLVGHSLWAAVRDFPFRAYHLGGLLLLVVAPPLTTPLDTVAFFPQYGLGAAWLVASGLADHWLLLSCLKRSRSAGAATASLETHPAAAPPPA